MTNPIIPPDTQKILEALRKVAADTLERKRRLGHYAVIWQDGKPVAIGEDALDNCAESPAELQRAIAQEIVDMDKLDRYRTCIQTLLEQYSQSKFQDEEIENALFFDTVRDRYQLMRVGWKGLSRIYHTVLHFDIKDGKIWLQQNTTDSDVGQELVDMGVPKEDIVLGLHPAYKRPYTGYGVA